MFMREFQMLFNFQPKKEYASPLQFTSNYD